MSTAEQRKHWADKQRKRRENARVAYNTYMRGWRKRNPDKTRAWYSKLEQRFNILKTSAKRRNFTCSLTFAQYSQIVSGPCYWCGGSLPPVGEE